jgi:hypothetical protein
LPRFRRAQRRCSRYWRSSREPLPR